MATIDSLEIQISAQASKANKSIDTLAAKLNTLSTSLKKIDGSNLSGLANGVSRLGSAVQTLNGVKTADYTRIAKGLEKFSKIDTSGFGKTASGLNMLARGISALSSIQNIGNITPAINALKNLAKVDMSGFDTTKMQSIANTMSSFVAQLSGVGKIEGSVTRLVSAMARLSGSGQYIGNVVTYFPQLGNQVVSLIGKLSSAGAIDASIAKIVDGIARLASAGKKVQDTVANLDKLGNGVVNLLNRLKNAPQINANIANTIQGLGNLASSGSRISTMSNTASGSTKKLGNALSSLKDKFSKANKSSKGFVSSIGMFYAKAFLLIRAVKKLGSSISSAQDYIEEFNYFSVALDKIGKDSANQFKEAGYNSAEEYAKSFRSRFAKLQTQLTGYKVDYDTGNATSQMIHNLGLDLTEVMNFNAAIAQITNSAGMLGETSITTSKALSMLSADWSSLSNQDLSDVMNNMQSALVGQSRAVYKYGIDITTAGLAQTALNHGIKVNISELNQQSKMQLRVLTMLEQSKVAYGDLARTINQPANQLRMLQAGFKNLSRTIGSLFMPIVQKLYPYLNAMVMVLQEFAQWIANLAGIKLGDVEGGVSTPDYSDAVDDSEDIAGNMNDTAKKAKKASDNLQGFDIINKLQENEDTDTDKSTEGNKNLDLSKELASALANYEKIWDKAFKSNQNKAVQLANKIKKALLDGWRKGGDFTDAGKAFAQWLNKGLTNIPWSKIKTTVKKIVRSIATFLNGFIEDLDWALVGGNIAEGLNTAIEASYTWWTTFNWLQFGTSLATMLNSALNKLDAKKLGKTLGAKLRGMIQFAFGFITTFNFNQLGAKIADSINGFFEEMGEVRQNTGLTGWQELGKSISDGIKGILDTINTALSTVKWTEIGKAIGDFLGSIDWLGILAKTGKTIVSALWSAIKTAFSAFASDPIGVGSALVTVLGVIFGKKALFDKLLPTLKTGFGNLITNSLTGAEINTTKVQGTFSTLGTKLGNTISKAVIGVFVAQIAAAGFKELGSVLNQWGEDINIKWVRDFGTGVEGFGTALQQLLSLDFSGFFETVASGIEAVKTAVGGQEYLEQKEADESGYGEQRKINKNIKEQSEKYASYSTEDFNDAVDSALISQEDVEVIKKYNDAVKKLGETEKKTDKNGYEMSSTVQLVNTAFNKGTITFEEYVEIANTSYDSVSDLQDALIDAKLAAKYMNGEVKNFNELATPMKNSLKDLGVRTENITKVEKELKSALQSGEISFEDYEAIVNSTYASTDDLYNKIDSLGKQDVTASIKAEIEGKVNVDLMEKSVTKLKKSFKNWGGTTKQVRTQTKKLASMVDDGTLSLTDYKKIVNGTYKSQKEYNKVVNAAAKKSDAYDTAINTMKTSMGNAKVPTDKMNEALGKLETAFDKGVISWDELTEATNRNYDSVEDVEELISSLKSKTIQVKAETNGINDVKLLKTSMSTLSNKTISATINPKLRKDWYKLVQKELQSRTFTVNATTSTKSNNVTASSLKNAGVKSMEGAKVDYNKLAALLNKVNATFDSNGRLVVPKSAKTLIAYLKKMSLNYTTYATGGFPTTGQLFIANEAGPELVGNMNGKNTVANQNEIAEGFAIAITKTLAPVMYAAFKQAAAETAQQNGGDVYLDGRKITESVVSHVNTISKSRGKSPIWGVT